MARDRRPAEELSIEELEALLARKRLEARQARLHQFKRTGRALRLRQDPIPVSGVDDFRATPEWSELEEESAEPAGHGRAVRSVLNRGLLLVEIAAVVGLAFVILSVLGIRQQLNQAVAEVLRGPTPSPTPLITAVVLPSGHTPPTSPGGSQPNESEIPANLRPLVQSLPSVAIPTPGPEQARNILIPALWNSPAPVVQGDGWEQLRRGVGQHIGSANPGEAGNVVLSAHNDIFGELFRYLDQLRPGDEIVLSTATQDYTYRVTGWRTVEPTEVDVMAATTRPTVTLISCYPYMVDDQRIVVFGELAE
ncbi:MAG: class D sortase [Anaerolineales bacterium]|nr:class D sortase [Anaerolineales bacterium]